MPLQNTNVIDLIAQDPASSTVILGMTEPRAWEGSDLQIFQLQEKVNAYLSFALDGEMHEHFPQFRDLGLRLELVCTAEPDERTAHFIELVRQQIGFQGIEFLVKVNPELAEAAEGGACASGSCGCKSSAEPVAHEHPTHSHSEGCCGGGHGHSHEHDHSHSHSDGCCGGGGHSHSHAHGNDGCCGGHSRGAN